MKTLSCFSLDVAKKLEGLLFDLDDTLLTYGEIENSTFDALCILKQLGLRLMVVTGRPASWGEVLIRIWPIDACVVENGALAYVKMNHSALKEDVLSDAKDKQVSAQKLKAELYVSDPCLKPLRQNRRKRLQALVAEINERLPSAKLTGDVSGRVSDVTWDIGETWVMPEHDIVKLKAIAEERGAYVITSNMHLHASYDAWDKASGTLRVLSEVFGVEQTHALCKYAYLGDSQNDRVCFASFVHSIGVSNVNEHREKLFHLPKYVTSKPYGRGFVEVANCLRSARGG